MKHFFLSTTVIAVGKFVWPKPIDRGRAMTVRSTVGAGRRSGRSRYTGRERGGYGCVELASLPTPMRGQRRRYMADNRCPGDGGQPSRPAGSDHVRPPGSSCRERGSPTTTCENIIISNDRMDNIVVSVHRHLADVCDTAPYLEGTGHSDFSFYRTVN